MRIPALNSNNYNRRNNQNFNGITKRMSHHIYIDGKKDIAKFLMEKRPKNTNVGQLPPVMFYALNPETREEKIRHAFKVFGEVSEEIRAFRPYSDRATEEIRERRPNSAVEKLKKLFVDFGLIKEEEPFDLKFLGQGEYKKAYKIEGVSDPRTGEELCYKVFHLVDTTPEWNKYKTHGNFAELNTSAHWKAREGINTQRGKFYFGDVMKGFFVDKFIERGVEPPKKNVNEYDLGLKLTDEVKDDVGHNKLYGYSIDPGGVRVVNRVKNESKVAQYVQKRIKNTPENRREIEWHKIKGMTYKIDKRGKEAGLALAIKHMPHKEAYVEQCLAFNNQFADMGLGYALKYLPEEQAKKYFEVLMKRKDPVTQTVLMNEIPLLARTRMTDKIDDLDIPRGEIRPEVIEDYYRIAEEHVLPEVSEHLASYIHLLPKEQILPEAQKMVSTNQYEVIDRLLHKIKFVKDEEFSYSNKMSVLNMIEKVVDDPFLKKKHQDVKLYLIRSQLDT